ncbi:MAG: hypothetical protein KUG82_04220 [Pseudomonadales bacterium]|nr:hypothetical protein [Pseudomonadales bacterium]
MNDNKAPLSDALKKHYVSKELSDDRWEALDNLQRQEQHQQQIPLNSNEKASASLFDLLFKLKDKRHLAIAASVLIVLALFPLQNWISGYQDSSTLDLIVAEVAYNHNKRMNVELESTNLTAIGDYLDRLDFSLIQSRVMDSARFSLVGGRYCSIQGELAAQLKIKDNETGELLTFYQFKRPKDFHIETVIQKRSAGALVKVWQEGDLLMSLAGA